MTPETLRRWLFALVVLAAAPAVAFCAIGFEPLATTGLLARGQVVGRDFAHTWAAGCLALAGRAADIWRPAAFQGAIDALFGRKLGLATFPYPPSALPLVVWVGALPYAAALAAWSLAGLAALGWATFRLPWRRRVGDGIVGSVTGDLPADLAGSSALAPRPAAFPRKGEVGTLGLAAALALSPAVILCLEGGQTGLITGALMLGALRLLDRRAGLAGVLLGLAAVKPHLVFLVPVALAAAGRWRAILTAALSAGALALVSAALFGADAWRIWWAEEVPYQAGLYAHATGGWVAFTTSPFGAALSVAPLRAAAAFQVAVTLTAAWVVWVRYRGLQGAPSRPSDWALLLAAGLAASPYSFGYDAAGLTAALLLWLSDPGAAPLTNMRRTAIVFLWSSPIAGIFLSTLAASATGRILSFGGLLVLVGFALLVLDRNEGANEGAMEQAKGPAEA